MKTVFCAALVFAASAVAFAGDTSTPARACVEVSILSCYSGRGMLINDHAVMQPSVTLYKDTDAGTFSINTWGNVEFMEYSSNGSAFNELDLTVGWTKTFGIATLGAGVSEYAFSKCDNTRKAYANIFLSPLTSLLISPSATVYYDFGEGDGFYYVCQLSRQFSLSDPVTMTVDTSLGYSDSNYSQYLFGVDKSGLDDFSAGVSFSYAASKQLTLSGGARYITIVDEDMQAGATSAYGGYERVVCKVTACYSF